MLERGGHRATVFFLGWVARRYPDLVREAARRGHEIGVHGDLHRRADEMTPAEFASDLAARAGVDRRRPAGRPRGRLPRGRVVDPGRRARPRSRSWRAPGFAATRRRCPCRRWGARGTRRARTGSQSDGWSLTELPPLTGRAFGRRLPLGGAWPFRLLSERRLDAGGAGAYRDRGEPAVFTFHPWEFDPAHPAMDGPPGADPRRCTSPGLAGLPERFARWLARDRCVGDRRRRCRSCGPHEPAAAFLFPGQLSEWVGMGRDFYDSDAEARELFALTSERCGLDLARILFEGPEDDLHENLAGAGGRLPRLDPRRAGARRERRPARRRPPATASATTPRWWRPAASPTTRRSTS